jgi:hypothetical protein
MVISYTKILIFNDINVEPISQKSSPEFKTSGFFSRPPVYLVSYADGPEIYYQNQNALALSVLNRGVDFILNYRRPHIDPTFYKKHAKILSAPKGAGFFIWKPHVILKTMKIAPENAIIIWADNAFACHGEIQGLINLALKHDVMVWNQTEFTLGHHNKRSNLVKMHCDTPACRQAPHIQGGFFMVRNTPRSREFVRQWEHYCADEKSITAILSELPNHPEFIRHLHDESILGILAYLHRDYVKILHNEDLKPYFNLHSRNTRYDPNAIYTILPRMKKI